MRVEEPLPRSGGHMRRKNVGTPMRKKLFPILAIAGLAAATLTCSPGYLIRAGIEEGKILSRRRPIERVIQDPSTSDEVRRKLRLVVDARTFAQHALGLDVGKSYTTFSPVDRDTLLLVVSAARRDRFEQVTWWFPIVGHVPYKGFFDPADALRAAEKLERRGYDTYVRPAGAFSTLGFFDDPLLSTVLRYDDVDLVSTVIHELTHNTIYVASHVSFNESFASFVGDRGAILFFCTLEGEEGERCRTARNRWADNLLFGQFLAGLIQELEMLYAREDLDPEARIAAREAVFERARRRFAEELQPQFLDHGFPSFTRTPLNNATLIARRLYFDRLDLFEAAFERLGQDLRHVVHTIIAEAEAADGDPFGAVTRLAYGDPGPEPVTGGAAVIGGAAPSRD